MKDACQRYLEEPEAQAGHLAECEDCRALFDTLGGAVSDRAVSVGALPLAPWEGASHRSWPVVAGGALLLLFVAAGVCAWAGVPPGRVVESSLGSMQALQALVMGAPDALRGKIGWQVGVGLGFLIFNTALVLLLRRAPRGIDA